MIREANIKDTKEIAELAKHLGYKESSIAEIEGRLETLIHSSNDTVWVYETSGTIVGWLHGFIANRLASPSFFEIGGMVVSPNHRRKGIGQSLVNTALNAAQSRKQKLRVRCNSKREDTHKFYQNIGFNQSKSQYIFEKE